MIKLTKIIIGATTALGMMGVAGAAAMAVGTVIGIDIGSPTSGNAGNFNEITVVNGGITGGTMIDTSGVIVDGVDVITALSFANADGNIGPADPALTALGFDASHLTDFGGRGTNAFVVFRNLDPTLTYRLEVVSAFDARSLGAGGTNVIINKGAGPTINFDTQSASPIAIFNGLTTVNAANEPNSINIQINAPGSTAVVNAIRLTAVPEPSSTALLGLGGLALILRRRK